jgi:hypothetical protein
MPGGGIHTTGKGHQACQKQGQKGQRNRECQASRNHVGHWTAIGVTGSHISMQQSAHPPPVAHDGRLIESELPFQGLNGCGCGVRAEQDLCSIARQDFQCGKNHHRRDQQGDSQCGKAFEQEQSHEGVRVWGWR